MSLKIGDIVEVIHVHDPKNGWALGRTSEVIKIFVEDPNVPEARYVLALDTPEMRHEFLPWSATQLRLKRPPSTYDGNNAGSWDLLPWNPYRVKERA